MGRKVKVSFELKIKAVLQCLTNRISVYEAATRLGVSWNAVQNWIDIYQSTGESGLLATSKNNHYSTELKLNAVQDYLSNQGSLRDISKKYSLRSTRQLRNWLMKYNSHNEIKFSNSGGASIMTKGRITTLEERIEIVKYCIEHERNYNTTAEKYQVSYQQVRSWTLKYEESGIDALMDRRGKKKSEDQLTELELLKAQNKLLEAKNKRLEMENEVLKKLDEIERGWI